MLSQPMKGYQQILATIALKFSQATVPSFDVVSFKHERSHNLTKYASNLEPARYLWLDFPPDP
jgi:hypothetical protein